MSHIHLPVRLWRALRPWGRGEDTWSTHPQVIGRLIVSVMLLAGCLRLADDVATARPAPAGPLHLVVNADTITAVVAAHLLLLMAATMAAGMWAAGALACLSPAGEWSVRRHLLLLGGDDPLTPPDSDDPPPPRPPRPRPTGARRGPARRPNSTSPARRRRARV